MLVLVMQVLDGVNNPMMSAYVIAKEFGAEPRPPFPTYSIIDA